MKKTYIFLTFIFLQIYFIESIVGQCTAPVLTAQANGIASTTTVCNGSSVAFTSNETGGSNCVGGWWEFSWFNDTNYWDGSAFTSATPLWSSTYNNISLLSVTATATYTAHVRCNVDFACTSQSSVTVNVLSSPASISAVLGSPANGLYHHLTVSWTTIGSADGYNIEYSNNGTVWNTLTTILSPATTTYDHNTGDNPDMPFYYRIRSYKGAINCSWTLSTPVYTACDNPEIPTTSNIQPTTLNLTIPAEVPQSNPANSTYSIFCTTTSQYVQANGTLGLTEIFQSKATWGTILVNGLSQATNYCFYTKVKNNDGDIHYNSGTSLMALQQFNSDVLIHTSPTNFVWYAPNSNTPIDYVASGGCTGGYAGYSGSWNNYWGNFVRLPQIDCSGKDSVMLSFDISNSYFAAQPSDNARFYIWADGAYNKACMTSVKVNGIEEGVWDINGRHLYFTVARTCAHVDVTCNLASVSNKTNILFYIEPSCSYNYSNTFFVKLDNIVVNGGIGTACATTTTCTLPNAGTLTGQQMVCQHANVMMTCNPTGTPPFMYQWYFNGTAIPMATSYYYSITDADTLLNTGNYFCQVTNTCGIDSTNIFHLNIVPLPPTPTITQVGNTLYSSATSGVNQWCNLSGTISGANGTTYNPPVSGYYYVFVVDTNGCISDTSIHYSFVYVGLNEYSVFDNISIYPNPNDGFFFIESNAAINNKFRLQLKNLQGEMVMDKTISNVSELIDVNHLSRGIYFMHVMNNTNYGIFKIVIQ